MDELLSPELVEAFKSLDTCTVSNAIEPLTDRLRNKGFTNRAIHRVTSNSASLIGYAATVRIRCSHPPMVGHAYADRTDWWNYILTIPRPRVVVIQDVDTEPGVGAILGEVHVHILQALGCVGAITNGTVRDLPALEKTGFQFFAAGLAVSHSYAHIVDFGGQVEVGGLTVQSGDLLHGDVHGVLNVPKEVVRDVSSAVAKNRAHERRLIDLCHSPDFSLEKLLHAINAP